MLLLHFTVHIEFQTVKPLLIAQKVTKLAPYSDQKATSYFHIQVEKQQSLGLRNCFAKSWAVI